MRNTGLVVGVGFGIGDDYGSLYDESTFNGNDKFGGIGSDVSDNDSDSDMSIASEELDERYLNKEKIKKMQLTNPKQLENLL